ncbi:MAG: methyltransferase domain-containing protein, partial [Defluviitaleaceae bacterium]|nr:methyltransferase domain-containing protein [Defluviitaleaceae bacterium]
MFNINLATASGVREVITRYGLQAKKKLGQHFLIDGHVLGKIISAAEIGPGDFVLEIGPGIGGMTQALAAVAGHVLAVELDKQLVPVLRLMFAEEKVTVVQGDILRLDLHQELLENKLISGAILTPRQSFALQNFATPLGKGVTPPSQANNLVG